MGSRQSSGPKRVSVSCSLPPSKAERLAKEAEERLIAPSVMLEKGLDLLFAQIDQMNANGAKVEVPKPATAQPG
jgi:hypothetical protein